MAKRRILSLLGGALFVSCGNDENEATLFESSLQSTEKTYIVLRENQVNLLDARLVAKAVKHYDIIPGFLAQLSDEEVKYFEKQSGIKIFENGKVYANIVQEKATWGLDRIDQKNLPLNQKYEYLKTGKGVDVFVIDTGIRTTHVDFQGRALMGVNTTGDGAFYDCNGHGTHVSGTIAGKTWGVAKESRLYGVKVLSCDGSGTWDGVIQGIEWAVKKSKERGVPGVINMSLGGGFSEPINQAVESAVSQGVSVVVAAGNESSDACEVSPASAPRVITVGASGKDDAFAYFSNYGKCVDIIAPGVNIQSSYYESNTSTSVLSGTSMASPHVAGVVALLREQYPQETPLQIENRLLKNAGVNLIKNLPSQTVNKFLYSKNENEVIDYKKIYCPQNYTLTDINLKKGQLCISGLNAYGPFSRTMVQKCKQYGGGSACDGNIWNKNMAINLFGSEKCPQGSSMGKSGFCVELQDAFGPFHPSMIEKCKGLGGGNSCSLARWNENFLNYVLSKM